jgi:hypothetical protein
VQEIKAKMSEHTLEDIKRIQDLACNSDDDNVRLKANTWLAEMVLGKANQPVTGPDGEKLVDVVSLMSAIDKMSNPE